MKIGSRGKKFTRTDLFKIKTRRSIYQFILKNPGLHFREICRKLDMSRGTLSYHLKYLEKRELINIKHDSKYNSYYAANKLGKEEQDLLKIIRFETTRNILFYMFMMGTASEIELSKELEKHPTTIEFHLKRLMGLDVIEPAPIVNSIINVNYKPVVVAERDKIGRGLFFKIKSEKLYDLLITYYNNGNHNDDAADAFFSFLEGVDIESMMRASAPRKLKTFKKVIEEVEDVLWDIFPNPYY